MPLARSFSPKAFRCAGPRPGLARFRTALVSGVVSDSATAKAEATILTSGEGTLESEEGALQQRVRASGLPGGEKDLLDANDAAAAAPRAAP